MTSSPTRPAAANLFIVAGDREDITQMDPGSRRVLSNILHLVDKYDLYGKVAYPKKHTNEDVPEFYRITAKTKGLFVNPALTEPFGLTLLEAAASGLPLIATADGGPQDIIGNCHNGILIDPLDQKKMGEAIENVLKDKEKWSMFSRNGALVRIEEALHSKERRDSRPLIFSLKCRRPPRLRSAAATGPLA